MNQKELMIKRNNTARLYKTPGTANLPRQRNAIFLNPSNSLDHELMKAQMCYNFLGLGHEILTEAEDRKTKERADIIDLDTGIRMEIETDDERAKRFIGRDIHVIMVRRKMEL